MPKTTRETRTTRRSKFCCYILQSDHWPTPYTGKTCDLTRRLHRHNHPSKRSRAYTKGKGQWRVAAMVFGLHTNRQSVWPELMPETAPVHPALALFRALSSMLSESVATRSCGGEGVGYAPILHVHVFKCALASWPEELLLDTTPTSTARISCHSQLAFSS